MARDFPEYTFAIADEEDYSEELKSLGLSDGGEEVNAAILADDGKKYAMEPEEFDSEVLRDFVVAFKKGEEMLCLLHLLLCDHQNQSFVYLGGNCLWNE